MRVFMDANNDYSLVRSSSTCRHGTLSASPRVTCQCDVIIHVTSPCARAGRQSIKGAPLPAGGGRARRSVSETGADSSSLDVVYVSNAEQIDTPGEQISTMKVTFDSVE